MRKPCFLVAVVACGATHVASLGFRVRGEEPIEECHTHAYWLAHGGDEGSVATGACPTWGLCDLPSVRNSWIPGPITPITTIRIKFNVFCETDGSNCTASPATVAAQIAKLNTDFAPTKIQFTEESQAHYIHDSTFREFTTAEIGAMMSLYNDNPGGQLNVYVVDFQGAFLGLSTTFPWGNSALGILSGVIVHEGAFCANCTTLTHEVGHSLGLWHTQYGVSEVPACSACYERADGTDGDITGDFASDTPPTPTNDTCFDPTGDDLCSEPPRPWAPTMPTNFMNYGPRECRATFTPQQAGRMRCWANDVLRAWMTYVSTAESEEIGETCRDGADNAPALPPAHQPRNGSFPILSNT